MSQVGCVPGFEDARYKPVALWFVVTGNVLTRSKIFHPNNFVQCVCITMSTQLICLRNKHESGSGPPRGETQVKPT